jgi:hypothetical protein
VIHLWNILRESLTRLGRPANGFIGKKKSAVFPDHVSFLI